MSRWRRLLILVLVLAALLAVAWPQMRATYHYHAAERALRRGEASEAQRHLEVCLRSWPSSPQVQLLVAQAARSAGFFEEADRRLDLCLDLGGDREAVNFERLLLEVQQGRFTLPTDMRIQELIDQKHPRLDDLLDVASRAYMRSYRLHSARYCLDLWVERQPDNLTARLRRGWVLERFFQTREAEQDYREALARHPGADEARLRLAQILLMLNEPAEAVEHLERLAAKDTSPAVLAGLAGGLRAMGQPEKAHEILSDAITRTPGEAPLWLERGRAALDLRRLDDAERDLRKAASLSPADYQINYQLSQCLRRRGFKEEADRVQEKATRAEADQKLMFDVSEKLQGRPYDADLRSQMGQLMIRNGEPREGVLWLQSALRVAPGFAAAHKALAEHYEKSNQPERAAEHRRALAGRAADAKQP